jgi:LemA protein
MIIIIPDGAEAAGTRGTGPKQEKGVTVDVSTFIFLGVLAALLLYTIILYNNLVRIKHNVDKAWSNIDVLLKQRHDELPKLVETCKQYMQYEQETMQKVMQARSAVHAAREKGDVAALGPAETQLRMGLGNLFAVAESYPDLKANEDFQHLQARISGLEDAIADRREFYNESANINNIRIEQFPDVILARMFNFGPKDLLEFSKEEKKDVDMKALFE